MCIEEFYNEGYGELTLYYEVGSSWNDLTEVKSIIGNEDSEDYHQFLMNQED